MAIHKSTAYRASVSEPASAGIPFITKLLGGISSAWAKWMDPACPTCGTEKSCSECLIEN